MIRNCMCSDLILRKQWNLQPTLRAGNKQTEAAWLSPQSMYAHPSTLKLTGLVFDNLSISSTGDRYQIDVTEPERKPMNASLVDKFT